MKRILLLIPIIAALTQSPAYAFWFMKTSAPSQDNQQYLADKKALEALKDEVLNESKWGLNPYILSTYAKIIGAGFALGSTTYTAFKLRTLTNKLTNHRKINSQLQHTKALKEEQDPLVDKCFANKGFSYKHSPAYLIKDFTHGSKKKALEKANAALLREPLDRLHENMQYNYPAMKMGRNIVGSTAIFAYNTAYSVVGIAYFAYLFKLGWYEHKIETFYTKHGVSIFS